MFYFERGSRRGKQTRNYKNRFALEVFPYTTDLFSEKIMPFRDIAHQQVGLVTVCS